MRPETIERLVITLALLALAFLVGHRFGRGEDVTQRDIDRAEWICSARGGLRSLDFRDATCADGAVLFMGDPSGRLPEVERAPDDGLGVL